MKHIQTAVADYLQRTTGVKTVCDRTRVQGEYPLLAVGIRKDGTTLISGGKQAENRYAVTVTAISNRERENNIALLASLSVPLLRGIPMKAAGEERILHPLNITTEDEDLTFIVELCVPVPPPGDTTVGDEGNMETLHFQV